MKYVNFPELHAPDVPTERFTKHWNCFYRPNVPMEHADPKAVFRTVLISALSHSYVLY